MAERIYITVSDAQDLRALVEQHSRERDGGAAARLAGELERAQILEPQHLPADVVTLFSRVTFENLTTGARREVVLVRPADADPGAGKVSVLAPIGAALIGLRRGDAIEWPLPGDRRMKIRILAVEQPNRAPEAQLASALLEG